MVQFSRNPSRYLIVAGDLFAVAIANLLAIALRFDLDWSRVALGNQRVLELLSFDLILTPLAFYFTGVYQGYWKYVGLDDLVRLVRAVGIRTISLVVIFYALDFRSVSRAVLIMATILVLILAGTLRLVPRFSIEILSQRRRQTGRRTLIIGAGDTGESLLRELRKAPHLEYNPVGFIDDDVRKRGVKIHGVSVLGDRSALERVIAEFGVREVIIAVPGASSEQMRGIFDICRRTNARFMTIPTRGELERGAARVSQIRAVDVEDLLGRDVVDLDQQSLRHSLSNRRVLVTGAAGSIGRELARQIADYAPAELILIDCNENNLFYLDMDMRETHPRLKFSAVVCDVRDRQALTAVMSQSRPHIIFHAAAYKHVPLMEQNPLEAVKNNIVGTRYLAAIAASIGVERFIYISTDKAVDPTSMMGATKRIGERLMKSTPSNSTRFMAVRFGNVLGSDGSVIPTFRRQIAAGGPITVTHPEATRYFMTVSEAVQLVLTAGAMGEGGETFLLQMGDPVRIVDLAKNLIELSGLKPDEDIRIVFTGLRPGEKLHETLRGEAEETLPTSNEKILVVTGVEPLGDSGWAVLESLEEQALGGNVEATLSSVRELASGCHPERESRLKRTTTPQKIVEIGAKKRTDLQA